MLGEAEPRRKALPFHTRPNLPDPELPSDPSLPDELAALRGLVPEATLRWARRRARHAGVGGDEVLLQAGIVDADQLAQAHARHLGLPLAPTGRRDAPPLLLAPEQARDALRTGVVAVRGESGLGFVMAPRGKAVRKLADALKEAPRPDLSLTAPERLRGRIAALGRAALAREAAFGLGARSPRFSATSLPRGVTLGAVLAFAAVSLAALGWLAPEGLSLCVLTALSVVFLCAMGLRLAGCLVPEAMAAPARLEDRDLPVYSLLVPLYREATIVPRLVAALRALDYPPEKLDIKLVVEPDDVETRRALRAEALPACFEILVAPMVGPRTKPKALNAALPFARGSFVAVFDAEDIPAPGQLRAALEAFGRGGPNLACVQARLVVENARDSWIARHFAIEYSAQFDVLLPALAAMRLPILLGGTSNHFRRGALEAAGAWDAFNVTEDADLGLRLARAGWEIDVIAADTLEEAPVRMGAWLRQRTRWMKGWAQTVLVHARDPATLLREMGPARAFTAALLTAGPFVAMTLHPISLAAVIHHFADGGREIGSIAETVALALSYANLLIGYAAAIIVSLVGLKRRGRLADGWILATLPAYWLLQSLAVWCALVDLVRDPHRWDKTEHGVARTLSPAPVRAASSDPPPPRPAGAWR
ncbi:glycosyltransferase [Aquabacter cavernae]|uniref:glycosyltransferase n=1 Tax=Aquabacter cavernae TaxID=2496029 RepID=UPI000F8F655C|nr:glycosyltransferase [Aquabacter cavernae]